MLLLLLFYPLDVIKIDKVATFATKHDVTKNSPKYLELSIFLFIFAPIKERKLMQVDTLNESQMMILESFAGAKDEEELNAGYVW